MGTGSRPVLGMQERRERQEKAGEAGAPVRWRYPDHRTLPCTESNGAPTSLCVRKWRWDCSAGGGGLPGGMATVVKALRPEV